MTISKTFFCLFQSQARVILNYLNEDDHISCRSGLFTGNFFQAKKLTMPFVSAVASANYLKKGQPRQCRKILWRQTVTRHYQAEHSWGGRAWTKEEDKGIIEKR